MKKWYKREQAAQSLPSLWWAGVITVGLVWYVGVLALPKGLAWIDDRIAMHASAAVFLVFSLLLDRFRTKRLQLINLLIQAVAAGVFISFDRSSTGQILNIVLVAQLPYIFGLRGAVLGAVMIDISQVLILWHFAQHSWTGALLNTALYACFQMFTLLIAHYGIQVSEARNRLAATNAELLATRSLLESSARDRERLRVSRELHDVAGHTLTALKLNLRQLREASNGSDRARLDACLEMSTSLLEDIRALVGNMRQHDPLDIHAALEQLSSPFDQPIFRIKVSDKVVVEDIAIAETILAVAREAITNVVRHAEATRCDIVLDKQEDSFVLEVCDNGHSIKPLAEGHGIRGMRERVESLGGGLDVTRHGKSGTMIRASVGAPN